MARLFSAHAHVCLAETCGNRLVGAFAAEAEIELLAEDRFPWPREYFVENGKVHVGAAHNRNKRLLGHHFISGACSTPLAAEHVFKSHAKGSFARTIWCLRGKSLVFHRTLRPHNVSPHH